MDPRRADLETEVLVAMEAAALGWFAGYAAKVAGGARPASRRPAPGPETSAAVA